jgi:hypothetical protein
MTSLGEVILDLETPMQWNLRAIDVFSEVKLTKIWFSPSRRSGIVTEVQVGRRKPVLRKRPKSLTAQPRAEP